MDWDEVAWLGYLASFVVLLSLAMSSIVRLRWLNLLGCVLFALYGYLIEAWPVVAMNLGIAVINAGFLYHLYRRKESFELISADLESVWLQHFLRVNRDGIQRQAPFDDLHRGEFAYCLLRDNSFAGLVVGRDGGDGVLEIMLDYVTPKYRDFKLGRFFYDGQREALRRAGYTQLLAHAGGADRSHRRYLGKMGFTAEHATGTRYFKTL